MQIAELKFGDVGRGLGHYRPVALAVGAVVVMGLLLPGPRRVAMNDFGASGWSTSAAAVVPSAAGDSEVSAEASAAFEAIESSPSDVTSSFASPLSPPSSIGSSFTSDAFVTREGSSESASSTFDSSTPSVSRSESSTTAASGPLQVTRSAWASAQAGTPLAATGVPAGSLPVGRRPGFEIDKVAFVKLSGGSSSLKLLPHDDSAGTRNASGAAIQACRVTTPGWAAAEAQSLEEAPAWDCAVAVLGKRADDGSWTFDLSVFPDRADERGFALIPTGSDLDFQVTFVPG
jgi:hypothetical protein